MSDFQGPTPTPVGVKIIVVVVLVLVGLWILTGPHEDTWNPERTQGVACRFDINC